ncbi:MAG: hypothetical protein AAGK00_05240 [Pseudomonadota bacterium]
MRAWISFAAVATLVVPAWAAAPDQVRDYDVCIALVENTPDDAVRLAGEWARYGGGAPARHCYALALIAVGAPSRAVDELLALAAEEPDLSAEARADVLIQAGEMLLDLNELAAAAFAAGEALRLKPSDRDALGLRGAVKAADGDLPGAIQDYDRALAGNQPVALILLRRAAARRLLGTLVAARDDAVFATEVDPGFAEAWLERGRIEARSGNKPAARVSLLQAIDLDREGSTGRQAQLVLQRMEAGLE